MSEDEIKIQAQDLIKEAEQENKKREDINENVSHNITNIENKDEGSKEKESNKLSKQNTVVNNQIFSGDSNSSSDSDSEDSSPRESENDKKKVLSTSMVSTDSSLENLMQTRDLNIKLFTLVSCLFCIGTTSLSIIGSLIFERVLTFNYDSKAGTEGVIKEITMNNIMIYILLGIITILNFGILIMISLNDDKAFTKLVYTELNWFFVLTQFAFGSLFLPTLIWNTDLWTINVCLSISMLTVLILSFYFTELKRKKNISKGSFIFIYAYISILFSFISYVTLYNISCILMENMEVQEDHIKKVVSIIIKVGINAGQTILSFVLLTYFKDVFFAFISAYIECSVFIHESFSLEDENIAIFVMALAIILGIILTICRYGKKTFGYEVLNLEILKNAKAKDFN